MALGKACERTGVLTLLLLAVALFTPLAVRPASTLAKICSDKFNLASTDGIRPDRIHLQRKHVRIRVRILLWKCLPLLFQPQPRCLFSFTLSSGKVLLAAPQWLRFLPANAELLALANIANTCQGPIIGQSELQEPSSSERFEACQARVFSVRTQGEATTAHTACQMTVFRQKSRLFATCAQRKSS